MKEEKLMKLGVITDEVTQDFKEALEFAREYGLDCVELRSVWEKGPFDYEMDDVLKIKALSDEYNIPVVAISSPFFKCEYSEENIRVHNEKFARLVSFAKILGAKQIRCFDFFKNPDVTREMIIKAYEKAYALCEEAGITILIESEPSTNTRSCKDAAELVRKMNKPFFKVLYDPGNNVYANDELPYPDGFNEIKSLFSHIHIKDAIKDRTSPEGAIGVAVGEGEVDYRGLFSELVKMGYSGCVMLETHYRQSGAKKLSGATLLNPKGSAISEGGYAASSECIVNLKNIIKNATANN